MTNEQLLKDFDNKFGISSLYAKPTEYMDYVEVYDEVREWIKDHLDATNT